MRKRWYTCSTFFFLKRRPLQRFHCGTITKFATPAVRLTEAYNDFFFKLEANPAAPILNTTRMRSTFVLSCLMKICNDACTCICKLYWSTYIRKTFINNSVCAKTLNLLSFRCFQSIHMDPSKNTKKGAYRALHNVVHWQANSMTSSRNVRGEDNFGCGGGGFRGPFSVTLLCKFMKWSLNLPWGKPTPSRSTHVI